MRSKLVLGMSWLLSLALLRCAAATSAHAGEYKRPDPATLSVEKLTSPVGGKGAPSFIDRAKMLCVGYLNWTYRNESDTFTLHFFPGDAVATSLPAAAPVSWPARAPLPPELEPVLAERCGEKTSLFVKLLPASYGNTEKMAELLADPRSFIFVSIPKAELPELRGRDQAESRFIWWASREVGYAFVVDSVDGRVRLWIIAMDHLPEEGERGDLVPEEDGPHMAKAKLDQARREDNAHGSIRGMAVLQIKDSTERLRVVAADGDLVALHLDAIIDHIAPITGTLGRYVITGLRHYNEIFSDGIARRFAVVADIKDDGAVTMVKGAFRVGRERRSVLLFAATRTESGKLRHSALAHNWLRFDPEAKTLRFELVPADALDEEAVRWHKKRDSIVARYRRGVFDLSGSRWEGGRNSDWPESWGTISITDKW